jgi:hypothetical protein
LQQQHHRHERKWVRLVAGARVAVHRLELELERVVEQLVTM